MCSLEDARDVVPRDPVGRGVDVDDDQRAGGGAARLLPLRGRGAGGAARAVAGDDPDGHPEGVHRAEGVHLPARAVDAAGHGHGGVLRARRCRCGIRSRSPATTSARRARRRRRSWRSRCRTGSRTWSGRWSGAWTMDEFAPRLSFFFNAHIDFFEEIAKYRAARRIWATVLRDRYGARDERSLLMRFHTQTAGVSLTCAAAARERGADGDRGAGGGAGRHAVAAHELLRRGARVADRGRGAAGAAHAAGDRARDRGGEHDRPARRLLPRGGADERAGAAGLRVLRPHRGARRHGGRDRATTSPSARSRRPPTATSRRSSSSSGSSSASTATRSPRRTRSRSSRSIPRSSSSRSTASKHCAHAARPRPWSAP